MDSTRPIRSLTRGLDALQLLNARGSATVADVVAAIRLPRTTVYRLLETLRLEGYVQRNPEDDRYRVTAFARGLGEAGEAVAAMAAVARPALEASSRRLAQPITFATPAGSTLRAFEVGAFAAAPSDGERRERLLASASGIAILAGLPAPARAAWIDAAQRMARRTGQATPAPATVAERIAAAAAAGYAEIPGEPGGEGGCVAVAIPAAAHGDPRGAVSLRFNSATLPGPSERRVFLAELQDCAARIAAEFTRIVPAARALARAGDDRQ